MKLQNQVCTLSQSQRLKELGIKQESHFYYFNGLWLNSRYAVWDWGCQETVEDYVRQFINAPAHEIYSAFTVAELGVMLGLSSDGVLPEKYNTEVFNDWITYHVANNIGEPEATMRTSVLIYLLENGLITADEVNNRLSND